MIFKICAFILFSVVFLSSRASAYPDRELRHDPPNFEIGKNLIVSIPAEGIKRGRVFLCDKDGIRIRKLERAGDNLVAKIEFLDLVLLKYQFQVEFEDGYLLESQYYYIRQPSTDDLEEKIRNLNDELSVVHTRIRQVENGLFSLNNTDSAVFQNKKIEEMGKALIVLRKKEKEHKEALAQAATRYSAWKEMVNVDSRGKFISLNREDAERDNNLLWQVKGH